MKDVAFIILVFKLLVSTESFHKDVENLFKTTNTTMSEQMRKNLDAVKDPNAPKGIQSIFQKKGEEFDKLLKVFEKKCTQELGALAKVNETIRQEVNAQINQVRKVFQENFDRFRNLATAEHYGEVKPFYDSVCAFHLIVDTLEDVVRRKKEYGGVNKARTLMVEMNKEDKMTRKEEKSPQTLLSSPSLQFYKESSNYIVPGEKRSEVDKDYDKWRLYIVYELNKLATNIRHELELIRGERKLEDVVAEFSFVMAKLLPFSIFVRQTVLPQTRRMAEKRYEKEQNAKPFLDELSELMPQKKWYFPKKYLHNFNVLRRAMKLRELEARDYREGDMQSVIPSSDECMQGAEYEGLYDYVHMFYSTTPKISFKSVT